MTQTPKIPVLLMLYSLRDGGTERQITEIAKWLDRSVFEPHVAAVHFAQPLMGELDAAGVPMLTIPLRSFASPSFIRSLAVFREYLRRHSIAVVHAFDPTATLFTTTASFMTPIPCLLSSQRAYRSLSFARYRPLLRLCDRRVDGIVVNCEAMRSHLVRDEKVPKSAVHVCYNSIDTTRFRVRQSNGSARRLTVGVACEFRKEKDLGTLLAAFAGIRDSYPETDLVLIGRGPEEAALAALSRDFELGDRCRFKPFQARIEESLPDIDIFVLPSLSEALSNALMEAMACGCCVVATAVGGSPEVVRHGETGMLFQPGDRDGLMRILCRLIEDPELRDNLRNTGARFIREHFSRPEMMSRLEGIYRDISRDITRY